MEKPEIKVCKEEVYVFVKFITDSNNINEIILQEISISRGKQEIAKECNEVINLTDDFFEINEVIKRYNRFGVPGTKISFRFYASDDQIYTIIYTILKNGTCEFEGTIIERCNNEEKKYFTEVKTKKTKEKYGKEFNVSGTSLNEYKNKIYREMCYSRENGGRKYKVSNGKLLGFNSNGYAYEFELETELNVSEDSPITLHMTGAKYTGTVLSCEGFSIIIVLDSNIESNISGAHLSVDPWRLLQSLYNKLDKVDKKQTLAMSLMNSNTDSYADKNIYDIDLGQEKAIDKCLNNPITVIWGPPGTGKTYTLANVAMKFLKQKYKVLMVSHSNISVDGLILELSKQIDEENDNYLSYLINNGKLLRYGFIRNKLLINDERVSSFNYSLKNDKDLYEAQEKLLLRKKDLKKDSREYAEVADKLRDIKVKVKATEKENVKNACLIATTISKTTIDSIFEDKDFDVVIFDEVSMAYVPHLVVAASMATKHFICVGDFYQLSPICQSDAKKVLNKDIFSKLGIIDNIGEIHYHPWLVMLNEQRRMFPKISEFSSKYIYHGLLTDHEDVYSNRVSIVKREPFKKDSVVLVDLSSTHCIAGKNDDNSRYNILSARVCLKAAIDAIMGGQENVGIITPYQAQSRLIQAMLSDSKVSQIKNKITCSTIHQFQGSERDVIIFDAVESFPFDKPGILMTSNDNNALLRLINVAITRARGKLVVVANKTYWESRTNVNSANNMFCKLLKYLSNNAKVVQNTNGELDEFLKIKQAKKSRNLLYSDNSYLNEFINRIESAEKEITITLPSGNLDLQIANSVYSALRRAISRDVNVYIKTSDFANLPNAFKKITWGNDEGLAPLTIIDNKYAWYGILLDDKMIGDKYHKYAVNLNVKFELTGDKTIEILKSLTDIDYRINANVKKIMIPKYKSNQHTEVVQNKELSGLGLYVYKNIKCPSCNSHMMLKISSRKKAYLECMLCHKKSILDVNDVKEYIKENNVVCPEHHCKINAKVTSYGLAIICECRHFINIEDI